MLIKLRAADFHPLNLHSQEEQCSAWSYVCYQKELWLAGLETQGPRSHFATDDTNVSKTLHCSGSQFITGS